MSDAERLYELLPAVYRIRDDEQGEPLRALAGILQEQLDLLEGDIAGLLDDWFIETCEEWVVPYIGDLLGVRLLRDIASGGLASQRALVANTLSHRRRKGTLSMLEDLARDVTGWGAHAVAFFELLGWTQNLDHLRYERALEPSDPTRIDPPAMDRVGTVNLRSLDVLDRIGGPFDVVTHTVDVRPVGQNEGWYGIRNVGIFVWRLSSYPMTGVTPRASTTYTDGHHFSPLGNPAPLFVNPERKADDRGLATEANVPGVLRPLAFFRSPGTWYGSESDRSLALYLGPAVDPERLIPVEEVLCKDLSTWSPPPPGMVAVDVGRGRIAFAPGETPAEGITASYHYGFSADIGGGPYDRRDSLEDAVTGDWEATISKIVPNPPPPVHHTSIAAALVAWDRALHPRAILTIADDATYVESLDLVLAAGQHLIVQADDRNRPTVLLRDAVGALSVMTISGTGGEEASLTLNGLQIEGGLSIGARSLGRLEIRHSTLVPGRALGEDGRPVASAAASLLADPDNAELRVEIASSIVGAIRLPAEMAGLAVLDSIVDRPEDEASPLAPRVALAGDDTGAQPGPPTTIERTTVFGDVHVEGLTLASESIFAGVVRAERRQTGCVRYSYVDDRVSVTPRRFRCQPELAVETRKKTLDVETLPPVEEALIRSRMRPDFTSRHHGRPGYAQLHSVTATEVRTGAESGAEMGVFESLRQPQRETNLRIRLEEYLPYGLAAGTIHVT